MTRYNYFDCERSLPGNDNKFPRNSSGSLELAVVPKEDYLNNHLARILITPEQQGTMGTRDEVLSIAGAQDMETSSYRESGLEDIEFPWEDIDLNMDAVFRPIRDSLFFSST